MVFKTGPDSKTIGLALGSGSARGWAHIGVIHELAAMGVEPDVVCGTSIGALVGAAYAGEQLGMLDEWVRNIERRDIIAYLDIKLAGGGFVEGKRLIDFFRQSVGDVAIEDLPKTFGAVATELTSGREVWFREGSLWNAIRASISLPGIFTPMQLDDQWLVDGGLVNPVPISLCRAMGADVVIAVNLNGDIVGKRFFSGEPPLDQVTRESAASAFSKLSDDLRKLAGTLVSRLFEPETASPGIFDVLSGSINIMQDRITRSRMAGDPPDVVLAPRLAHIQLMEFDRAAEAIEEGRRCVRRMAPAIQDVLRDLRKV